jgi:DNA-binding NtrC family response regulator
MTQTLLHETAEPQYPRANHNVLCIDADDESRLLVSEILYEHDVDFALTADDAVQLAHSRSYDLYLLDPCVPGYADFDLVRELRRFDAHVPLVICSAPGRTPVHADLIQAHLDKPLSARLLREIATRVLAAAKKTTATRVCGTSAAG